MVVVVVVMLSFEVCCDRTHQSGQLRRHPWSEAHWSGHDTKPMICSIWCVCVWCLRLILLSLSSSPSPLAIIVIDVTETQTSLWLLYIDKICKLTTHIWPTLPPPSLSSNITIIPLILRYLFFLFYFTSRKLFTVVGIVIVVVTYTSNVSTGTWTFLGSESRDQSTNQPRREIIEAPGCVVFAQNIWS